MAIIFAVVGGGAIVAIGASSSKKNSYDDYDDYDDDDDYDDYDDYDDEAERRRRRMARIKNDIESEKININAYKVDSINQYLQSQELKRQSGVTVSVSEVKKDGNKKISDEIKEEIDKRSFSTSDEVKEINLVLKRIEKILAEEK